MQCWSSDFDESFKATQGEKDGVFNRWVQDSWGNTQKKASLGPASESS